MFERVLMTELHEFINNPGISANALIQKYSDDAQKTLQLQEFFKALNVTFDNADSVQTPKLSKNKLLVQLINFAIIESGINGKKILEMISDDQKSELDELIKAIVAYSKANVNSDAEGTIDAINKLLSDGIYVEIMNFYSDFTPLMIAALLGNTQLCKDLIAAGADVNAVDDNKKSILVLANGSKELIDAIIENGADVNVVDKNGWTPLIHAAMKGDGQKCISLLEHKANANVVDSDGMTALMYAATVGRGGACEALIAHGVDINFSHNGMTALKAASESLSPNGFFLLIENNADMSQLDQEGKDKFLLQAAELGKTLVFEKLIKAGAKFTSEEKVEAIGLAAKGGHTKLCSVILERADTDEKDRMMFRAIQSAVGGSRKETCLSLIENYPGDKSQWTMQAMKAAVSRSENDIFMALVHDIEEKIDGVTLLALAVSHSNIKLACDLIEKNADLSVLTQETKHELLVNAASLGREYSFERLLKEGAKLTQQELEQALIDAASNGHTKICLSLIEHADENDKQSMMLDALFSAVKVGNIQTCLALIASGGEKRAVLNIYATKTAAKYNQVDTFMALIEKREPGHESPLMIAAMSNNLAICESLISKGANVNEKYLEFTALTEAVKFAAPAISFMLIENNADVSVLDQAARSTLLNDAAKEGRVDICDRLLKVGAKFTPEVVKDALFNAAINGHTKVCSSLIAMADEQDKLVFLSDVIASAASYGLTETCLALIGISGIHQSSVRKIAIECAAKNNRTDTFMVMIENINAGTLPPVMTPLMIAAKANSSIICAALLDKGVQIDQKIDGLTALELAAMHDAKQASFLLIEKNADISVLNQDTKDAFLLAAIDNARVISCEKLLKGGAQLKPDEAKEALAKAASAGNTKICTLLIKHANVNNMDDMIIHALDSAVKAGHDETCLTLIENSGTKQGYMNKLATTFAAINNQTDIFMALIEKREPGHETPLMVAATNNSSIICATLIGTGVDVNQKDNNGNTALSMAALKDSIDASLVLIENGADMSVLNQDTKTKLLFEALRSWRTTISEKLIMEGVDLTSKDENGNTPFMSALKKMNSEIYSLIIDKAKTSSNPEAILSVTFNLLEGVYDPALVSIILPYVTIDGVKLSSILTPSAFKKLTDNMDGYFDSLRTFNYVFSDFIRIFPAEDIAMPDLLIAFDIVDVNAKVKKFEDSYKDNSETAMSPREMSAAKTAYEIAQTLYDTDFKNKAKDTGGDEHEAIINIESELRNMLLDKLLEEGDTQVKEFIELNREALKAGQDSAIMQKASTLFSSKDNDLHIAWRAYDKYSATSGWINLLTPPPATTSHQFGAGEKSTQDISWDVRRRVAYYFIALKDKTHAMEDQTTREAFFIKEIAEIRRAHNENDPQSIDNPSCYPGTVGRIGKMGRGHSKLAVINPIDEIPGFIQGLLSSKLQEFLKDKDEKTQIRLVHALSDFTSETIKDTLKGKNILAVFDISQEELNEIVKLHNETLDLIGNVDQVFSSINAHFSKSNPPIRQLVDEEKIYINRQIKDINYKGVGLNLAQKFRPEEKISNPYPDKATLSINDFIMPLQRIKQKHKLTFDLFKVARLYHSDNDTEAKQQLTGATEQQLGELGTYVQTVRGELSKRQENLDQKRELWNVLFQDYILVAIENKSEVLKNIVDENIDEQTNLKDLLAQYKLPLPTRLQEPERKDEVPTPTSIPERRKSLLISDKGKGKSEGKDKPQEGLGPTTAPSEAITSDKKSTNR